MIRDITIGQYYPAKSVLHRLDPRVKLVGDAVISDFIVFIQQHSGICDDNIVPDHYY